MSEWLRVITIIGSVGGTVLTVGGLLSWYNSRIESRVVIRREINHLKGDVLSQNANTAHLHDEQEKELRELQQRVKELENKTTNLYWMIKTIMAKLEISASSLGFDKDE